MGSVVLTVAMAAAMTAGSAHAAPLAVQDMNNGATAQAMAQALVGGGVTISNVTYTGTPNAGGSFTGGDGIIGFDSGIVLGSGSVQTTLTSTSCNKGVEGPNECSSNTSVNGQPGDADLSAAAQNSTFDAAILEFDFVPQFGTVQFSYVFSSDEYNEYVNSGVNDVFGFFVNGQNCALIPGTNEPVTIDTVNLGHNSEHYRDNEAGGTDTEMDGLTVVLTCEATVNAGVTNHLKLAIADSGDDILDSNVFIQSGSLVSGTQISTTLSGGGQTGEQITVQTGTAVTDSATLSGANVETATGTVTYTVYSDSACQSVFTNAGTKAVSDGNAPDSEQVTFTQPGAYYWVASYSGDSTHNASASECGAEVVTVEGSPEPPPSSDKCKVTGGGRIRTSDNHKATFGGNAKGGSPPKGSLQYTDHGKPGVKVKSIKVLSVACSADGREATVQGSARANGDTVEFRIDVRDLGEPGRDDTYRIRLSNGYDSGEQQLQGGNIQIHAAE